MFEIAGVLLSGIGVLNNLLSTHKDLTSWSEEDLRVDSEWLGLALQKGVLEGQEGDFRWSKKEKVATRELKGMHQVVLAFNTDKKTKYRIVLGREPGGQVLMKRSASARVAAGADS